MKVYIDEDKPHVIRSESGAVVAVLVDYPLCRKEIGEKIVKALNGDKTTGEQVYNNRQWMDGLFTLLKRRVPKQFYDNIDKPTESNK